MHKHLIWLVFLFLCGGKMKMFASDVMGSDLQYRCIGKDSFEFTAIVYKDCKANWAIPNSVYNLGFSGIGCSFNQTISPTLESCKDITPVCKKSCTQCMASQCNSSSVNSSCSFPYGIEKLVWKAVVYLGNTSCCKFRVSYIGNSTRNYAINTCCSGENFYTYLEFDRCLTPCNNSPQITNDPVAIFCVGQDICINNGAQDTMDNDSLSYHLAPALTGYGSSASYTGSYTYQKPLYFQGFPNNNAKLPGGFHLDSITGDLCFRPMQQQVSVIVVEIREWRKDSSGVMRMIGKTRRDMQVIIVNNCKNKNPWLDVTKTRYDVCALEQICFTIPTKDNDNNDTTRVRWNYGIPRATFSENNGNAKRAEGEFCWTPLEKDASSTPYFFNVTVWDDACPLAGMQTRTFSVIVKKIPKANRQYTYLGCGKYRVESTPLEVYNNPIYTWTVPYPGGKIYKIKDTLIQFQSGGKQVIRHTIENGGCLTPYFDTIDVPEFPSVALPSDTAICLGNSLNLSAVLSHHTSAAKIQWSTGETSTSISITPKQSGFVSVYLTDTGSCRSSDSIYIQVLPPPKSLLGPDLRMCPGDSLSIDPGDDSGRVVAWIWNDGSTHRTKVVTDSSDHRVRILDTLNCYTEDTISVRVNTYPQLSWNGAGVCLGDSAVISALGADSFVWMDFSGNILQNGGNIYRFLPAQSMVLRVKGISSYQNIICYSEDSVTITVSTLPVLSLRTLPDNKCTNFGQYMFTVSAKDLNSGQNVPGSYQWILPDNSCLSGNTLDLNCYGGTYIWKTAEKPHYIKCIYTTNTGCKVVDSVPFTIHPQPIVRIDARQFCAGDASVIITGSAQLGAGTSQEETWSGNGVSVNSGIYRFHPNSAGPGEHLMTFMHRDANGCEATDTAIYTVTSIPSITLPDNISLCGYDSIYYLKDILSPSPASGYFIGQGLKDTIQGIIRASELTHLSQPLTYYYRVSDKGCYAVDSVKVRIHPLPSVSISPDLLRLCFTQSPVQIRENSGLPGIGRFYRNGEFLIESQTLTIHPAKWGVGYFQVVYEYLDPWTLCKAYDTALVNIEPESKVTFSAQGSFCIGDCFELLATGMELGRLQWKSDGNGIFFNVNDTVVRFCPSELEIQNRKALITVTTGSNSICPPAIFTDSFNLYAPPNPEFTVKNPEGCSPLTSTISLNHGVPDVQYTWRIFEAGTNIEVYSGKGLSIQYTSINTGMLEKVYDVWVEGITLQGCDSFSIKERAIRVFPMPDASFLADPETMALSNPRAYFENTTPHLQPDSNQYYWYLNGKGPMTQTRHWNYLFPSDTGRHRISLSVVNKGGCRDSVNQMVRIVPDLVIYVPTAFTPDKYGPEENNTFYPSVIWYDTYELTIYNRWGELIYTGTNPQQGWDGRWRGKDCPMDVYAWVIRTTDLTGKPFTLSGTVSLLR